MIEVPILNASAFVSPHDSAVSPSRAPRAPQRQLWQARLRPAWRLVAGLVCLLVISRTTPLVAQPESEPLRAGAAKVEITDYDAGPVNAPLFARALVVQRGEDTLVMVAVDAVAIGEIGYIDNDYLPTVRKRLEAELGIDSQQVLINASHCHGVVRSDVDVLTVQAVKEAAGRLVPVKVGVGVGQEDRIMENRRLQLKDGRTLDVRHAYSLPPDEQVAQVGPVDPEIGILRLDRIDGGTVAVVYNFACHPIQGVPGGRNTADMTGFASKVIEDNLSEDTVALFIQGCAGDINPAMYKHVDTPRHAEPLGNMLGLSTLQALRRMSMHEDARLRVSHETLTLPRADNAERIAVLEAERMRLLRSLKGTSLNLKTFLPLAVKYSLAEEFPAAYSYRYLHESARGRDDLEQLDAENRRNIEQYIRNIQTMEQLTRVQTNLALLKKHQAELIASGKRTIDVELMGVRIGEFVLVTSPGELTVQIGLNLKQASPHEHTFVAGYTNGYIYYAPTAEQLLNVGNAQEDSDCILAPEWQEIFETRALKMLQQL